MDVPRLFCELDFAGRRLRALACGALWWPEADTLLVADLHLEKASWAAARGWMLPPHDSLVTLDRLAAAVAATGVGRVVALGDSFHDPEGPRRLPEPARARLDALTRRASIVWLEGNHDAGRGHGALELEGVALRHAAASHEQGFEISGHWHPAVTLALRGGGSARRRCFARTAQRLVLPAYGALAGGLDVAEPALAAALGATPEALVWTRAGMARVPPRGPAIQARFTRRGRASAP